MIIIKKAKKSSTKFAIFDDCVYNCCVVYIVIFLEMAGIESGYNIEQSTDKSHKVEDQSYVVYNATDFLSKFKGVHNNIVSACLQEIQTDTQLKEGFDILLQSGISKDFIDKIKQELEDNSELDEETLKFLVQSIIVENIENFRIGSMVFEGISNQMSQQEERLVQDQEQLVQDQEQLVQDQEQLVQDNIENSERRENLNAHDALKKSIQERDKLLDNHTDKNKVSEIKKKIGEKTELAKQQLPMETKMLFEKNGYNERFIDEYLLVKITLNEVNNDSSFTPTEIADFKQSVGDLDISFKLSNLDVLVKSIDNVCNIPDSSLSSFSNNNLAKTRTELFHETVGNGELRNLKKNNIDKRYYSKYFSDQLGDEELIEKYGKFLEGDLKEFCSTYQDDFLFRQNVDALVSGSVVQNYSADEKEKVSTYNLMISSLENLKNTIEGDTKDLVEELCITAQIKGMLQCIPSEYVGAFQFNKAKEISWDNNGILKLDGHINGVNFSLMQNTNDVNARLQTSTMLQIDNNKFNLKGGYKDSPFILPTSNQVFDIAIGTLDSEDLLNVDGKDDYLKTLEQLILKRMDNLYTNTKYAHHYLESQIENELILDDTKKIFSELGGIKTKRIDEEGNEQIIDAEDVDQSRGKLYNFFDMINFNLENMTLNEKKEFGKCIKKLLDIVSEGGHEALSDNLAKHENLAKFLGSKRATAGILNKDDGFENSWTFFDFFRLFLNKNGMVDVDTLSLLLDKDEATIENIWKKYDELNKTNSYTEYCDLYYSDKLNSAYA